MTRAIAIALSLVAGCSTAVAPQDVATAVDSVDSEHADLDAAPDVPSARDVVDVPFICVRDAAVNPTSSLCDGNDHFMCLRWAQSTVTAGRAFATCDVVGSPCQRASSCPLGTIESCRCGDEPACADDSVCWAEGLGFYPHCTRCVEWR